MLLPQQALIPHKSFPQDRAEPLLAGMQLKRPGLRKVLSTQNNIFEVLHSFGVRENKFGTVMSEPFPSSSTAKAGKITTDFTFQKSQSNPAFIINQGSWQLPCLFLNAFKYSKFLLQIKFIRATLPPSAETRNRHGLNWAIYRLTFPKLIGICYAFPFQKWSRICPECSGCQTQSKTGNSAPKFRTHLLLPFWQEK